jgi:hypothetical protein
MSLCDQGSYGFVQSQAEGQSQDECGLVPGFTGMMGLILLSRRLGWVRASGLVFGPFRVL